MADVSPTLVDRSEPGGIYVHIPFCMQRCSYCGFYTVRYDPGLVEDYLCALRKEIRQRSRSGFDSRPSEAFGFDTLYFGGGTPSLLDGETLGELVDLCREFSGLCDEAEITVEANPGTVRPASLKEWRRAGINRVSLGIQSLDDRELKRMGRPHTAQTARRSFLQLREAGFDNIAVDLIAGYPGQTVESTRRSLEGVAALGPEHLSVYLLEVKQGTRLEKEISTGLIPVVDDDIAADIYEDICRVAGDQGLVHYEISNFAKNGGLSRHNLKYWQDGWYCAFGAGAVGFARGVRYANVADLNDYMRAVQEGLPACRLPEHLSREEHFREALIMGLRLTAGVDLDLLTRRFHIDARSFVARTAGDLMEAGLCKTVGARLILTPRGRLLSNLLFCRWV